MADWLTENKDIINFVVGFLSGTGVTGVAVLLVSRFLKRPKLSVMIKHQPMEDPPHPLTFEAENRGETAASLERQILLTAWAPKGSKSERIKKGGQWVFRIPLEKVKYVFLVATEERGLPPGEPKSFSAEPAPRQTVSPFLWFYKYKFKPSKGRVCTVYVRNVLGYDLSLFAFYWQRFLFLRFPDFFHRKYDPDSFEV